MANFLRLLTGIALLPACWGAARALGDMVVASAGAEGVSAEALSLLGGIAAFALAWTVLGRPVKAYVLGHELTHAIWGLMFGAIPSDLRVGEGGGSVRLTKSNMLITLAPYFFPFYTFVVIVCALVTLLFVQPLPFLPAWMFLVGFTWAFHVLFTLETLGRRQPDVKLYGRVFSWTFILVANVLVVIAWLAAATSVSFREAGGFLLWRVCSAYSAAWGAAMYCGRWIASLCTRT